MATSNPPRIIRCRTSAVSCPSAVLGLGLGLLLLGSGCVSQSAFEEAQSVAQVEREAHLRAEARLAAVEQSMADIQGDLTRREAALVEHERRLAEADLNLKLAHQERDASGQLVDQLRGELARVGDHLRVYSEQKDRLADELRVVEGRSKQLDERSERLERFASIVRDLSLLEGPAIHTGSVLVGSDGRDPLLSAPAQALGTGNTLSDDARRIVKALGRIGELHPYAHFVISETTAGGVATDPARLRALSEALIGLGVTSERVVVAMAESPSAAGGIEAGAAASASEDSANAAASAGLPTSATSEARVTFVIQIMDASAPASPTSGSEGESGGATGQRPNVTLAGQLPGDG